LAEKRGAKGRFPAMRAEDLKTDGVEVGAEKRAWFITGSSPQQSNESLLR